MGVSDWFFAKDSPKTERALSSSSKPPVLRDNYGRRPTLVVKPSRASIADVDSSIRHEMVVAYLYQQQLAHAWISDARSDNEGAVIRQSRKACITCPRVLEHQPLTAACIALNVTIALTVHSQVVKTLFSLDIGRSENVHLRNGRSIQIVPTIHDLARARRHQFAAFVAEGTFLLVWDDDPNNIIARIDDIERQLVEISWRKAMGKYPMNDGSDRKESIMPSLDEEAGGVQPQRRRIFINAVISTLTILLILGVTGLGWKNLAQEVTVDGNYARLALILVTPIQFFLALFFMQVIIGCCFQVIGPIGQIRANTRFYSGTAPRRLKPEDGALPHVTIQCPVYTEGLRNVIEGTVMSLKAAISTYEMQGGSAHIFVNDDGMQAKCTPEEIQERIDFYATHNIGWVARPAHNPNPTDGSKPFLRRGKFKKASNMNYALMVSSKVEERLVEIERDDYWNDEDEFIAYEKCLKETVEELENRAWAGGDIRMGDYILLVDSDTRIPNDCLLDAVSELEQSPEVAILQYAAGVLKVADDYFENGIAFFTDLIYTAISFMVANGDAAPFVGHNAVLRWSAMQDVPYYDEDQYVKFWSESSVSEDFDMSLRLQSEGWTIRLGTYTGQGYKEGVSLTVYDELTRWEKYAYGCSELLFHPLKDWPFKGPFTPLVKKFLGSKIPLSMKLATLGYIGTYYAIGCAWVLTLMNYFLVGWLNGELDHWYLNSFEIYFALVIVFSGISNVALAVLRYRIQDRGFLWALIENFKWILLFVIFFGGLSISISQALLCHLVSIDVQWSTTAKEVENSNFFQEVPKLLRRFKWRFLYCIICMVLILVCAFGLPPLWQIREFTAIYPLAIVVVSHFLLPIVLNPALVRFTF